MKKAEQGEPIELPQVTQLLKGEFEHRPLPPKPSIKHCAELLLTWITSQSDRKNLGILNRTVSHQNVVSNQLSESFFTSISYLLLYFS